MGASLSAKILCYECKIANPISDVVPVGDTMLCKLCWNNKVRNGIAPLAIVCDGCHNVEVAVRQFTDGRSVKICKECLDTLKKTQ